MAASGNVTFQYHNGTTWTSQLEAGTACTVQYTPATGFQIGGASDKLAFLGATPVVKQVLATGAGATADNIISLLQTLGLCKQS